MFDRILSRVKQKIRMEEYVMTIHADEEMDSDALNIYDVEHAILRGEILERQKDAMTAEWKYRIQGPTIESGPIEIIVKLGPTGKALILTVYRL